MDVHARLRTESHQQVTGAWACRPLRLRRGARCRAPVLQAAARHAACTVFHSLSRRSAAPPRPLHAGRFNERLVLSLASCRNCILMDDELNILPTSTHVRAPASCVCLHPT